MEPLESTANDPEALRKELVRSFSSFESSFRNRFPVLWLTTLLAPVVVTVILLVGLGLSYGWGYPQKLIGHALATFFIFGRFIVLVGTERAAAVATQSNEGFKVLLSPGELFAMVTYMDVMVALFVTFHMGILFRLPNIGPKIAMLVWDGKFIMDAQPWIKASGVSWPSPIRRISDVDHRQHWRFHFRAIAGPESLADRGWRAVGQHSWQCNHVCLFQADQSVHRSGKLLDQNHWRRAADPHGVSNGVTLPESENQIPRPTDVR